jgi:Zn-dependent protease with chaperone function
MAHRTVCLLATSLILLAPGRAAAQRAYLSYKEYALLFASTAASPQATCPAAVPWASLAFAFADPFSLIMSRPSFPIPTTLFIGLDPERPAHVQLTWCGPRMNLTPDQARAAVEAAVGPLEGVQATNSPLISILEAHCPELDRRRGLGHYGRIDLAPLLRLMPAGPESTLTVVFDHPRAETLRLHGPPTTDDGYQYIFTLRPDSVGTEPGAIEFEYGPPDDWPLRVGLLAGILLLPIVLTLWRRRWAVRLADTEPVRAWHGYHSFLRWTVMVFWPAWWLAVPAVNALGIAKSAGWLSPRESVEYPLPPAAVPIDPVVILLGALVFIVPPGVVTGICHALGRPVHARLRGEEWTSRDMLRQGVGNFLVQILPLMMVIAGIALIGTDMTAAIRKHYPHPGDRTWIIAAFRRPLAMFLAAFVATGFASRFAARSHGITLLALTAGALRDRAFELAGKAGVKLRQLYVIPEGRGLLVNAFAVAGDNVLLSERLIRQLTRREVDAIVAHELGHIGAKHLKRMKGCLMPAIMVVVVTGVMTSTYLTGLYKRFDVDRWWWPMVALPIFAVIILATFRSRRWERTADAASAKLTGDPEAMITGLAKIARLTLTPLEWGRAEARFITHPSMRARFDRIAEEAGVPPARVEELLADLPDDGERYPLPPLKVAERRVFSTEFKSRRAIRNAWVLTGVIVLTPVLVAYLVWTGAVPDPFGPWVLVLGVPLTVALQLTAVSRLAVAGDAPTERGVRERLARDGLDPAGYGGTFVGFGPDSEPRIYEGNFDWDMGFLTLTGDRLTYIGEQARFGLDRGQVTGIELASGAPNWIRTRRLYVRWTDGTASGVFHLRGAGVRWLSRVGRESDALADRLNRWRGGERSGGELPEALRGLGPPATGEVTSIVPRELINWSLLRKQAIRNGLLALAVGVVAGLPWWPFERGLGWYAVAVTLGMNVFMLWPHLRSRGVERT